MFRQALDEYQPVAALSFGLWPGEAVIRLERVAINCADFEIPDNTGQLASEPVVSGGADAHLSTLPIHAIRDRLLEAGIPARLSGSTGTFLCNALMYTLLDHCVRKGTASRCGFIHVPYLPAQAAEMLAGMISDANLEFHQRADVASMALETMVQTAHIAIETTMSAS